jgi:hypothetical protein
MDSFTSAKPNRRLHFVPILEETFQPADEEFEIVLTGSWAKPNFLDRAGLLALLTFPLLACLVVLELAVVKDLGDRRLGIRRNLHQVKAAPARHCQGLLCRNYANLLTVFVNQANFADPDLIVDPGALGSGSRFRKSMVGGSQRQLLAPRRIASTNTSINASI